MIDAPNPSPDPREIETRTEFTAAIRELHHRSALTLREISDRIELSRQAINDYVKGKHLPRSNGRNIEPFMELLHTGYGITDRDELEEWKAALRRVAARPGPRPTDEPTPYPGLQPFREEDHPWYFGREDDVAGAVRRIRATVGSGRRALIVTGPSGVGKSSLINAGICATIKETEEFGAWRTNSAQLGVEPLDTLDAALERFQSEPQILVIDQLEALWSEAVDPDERHEFLDRLDRLTDGERDPAVFVVMGLRADFYGHALQDRFLTEVIRTRQIALGEMRPDRLKAVIERPAESMRADVEPELTERLLHDLAAESVLATGALPLLALTLEQLWKAGSRNAMTVADYISSGGLANVIRDTAETAWKGLETVEREAAQSLLPRMVNVQDDLPLTRRHVSDAELESARTKWGEAIDSALRKLADSRLVVYDEDGVTLVHDSLLHAWPDLSDWIQRDRRRLTVHSELARSALNWESHQRHRDYLYGSARLASTEQDLGTAPSLTGSEAEFLTASRARADRRRRIRRMLVTAIVVLLAASTGSLAVALDQHATATEQRSEAESRMMASQFERLRESDPALAAQLAVAAYRASPTLEARSALLSATAIPTATRMLANDDGIIQRIAVNSEGDLMAATGDTGKVWVWDIAEPLRPRLLLDQLPGTEGILNTVEFGPGRRLYTGGSDDIVYLHDLADPDEPTLIATAAGPVDGINLIDTDPRSGTVAVGGIDGALWLWGDPDLGGPPVSVEGSGGPIKHLAFNADGDRVAVADFEGTAWIHDVASGNETARIDASSDRLMVVAFSPEGDVLATGDTGGAVKLWELGDEPALAAELRGPANWLYSLVFLPGTPFLAAGASDGLWLWNRDSDAEPMLLPSNGPVTDLAVHPDDGAVFAGYADGSVKRWLLPGPVLVSPTGVVHDVEFLSDDATLAVAGGGDAVWLWDTADPNLTLPETALRPPDEDSWVVGAVSGSPDRPMVAAAGRDGRIWIWGEDRSGPVRVLGGLDDFAEQLMFSPDSKSLAAAGTDGTLAVWDLDGGDEPIHSLEVTPGRQLYTVRYSPDGEVLATGGFDLTVRLWDIADDQLRPLGEPLTGPEQLIIWTTFDPTGTLLAAGSADGHVYLWDVTDPTAPKELPALEGNGARIAVVDFSPDGEMLAAASFDGTVIVWNVEDPRNPRRYANLTGADGGFRAVDFSTDGSMVAAAGDDPEARLWATDPEAAIETICAAVGAPITPEEWQRHIPGVPYENPC